MPAEHSAGLVLFRKEGGKRLFLLLHYPHGHWDFPKGHIEAGETPEQAAARELQEETGIKNPCIFPHFQAKVRYIVRESVPKTVVYFIAETAERSITLSDEHISSAWLPAGKALEQLTFDSARKVLRKAVQFLEAHA